MELVPKCHPCEGRDPKNILHKGLYINGFLPLGGTGMAIYFNDLCYYSQKLCCFSKVLMSFRPGMGSCWEMNLPACGNRIYMKEDPCGMTRSNLRFVCPKDSFGAALGCVMNYPGQ